MDRPPRPRRAPVARCVVPRRWPRRVSAGSPTAGSTPRGAIALVSWNVNAGAGDLAALVRDLRAGRLSDGQPVGHFVLLLQEALRIDSIVPAAGADREGARRLVRSAQPVDVVAFAREAGLSLFYLPSMRNGLGAGGWSRRPRQRNRLDAAIDGAPRAGAAVRAATARCACCPAGSASTRAQPSLSRRCTSIRSSAVTACGCSVPSPREAGRRVSSQTHCRCPDRWPSAGTSTRGVVRVSLRWPRCGGSAILRPGRQSRRSPTAASWITSSSACRRLCAGRIAAPRRPTGRIISRWSAG